MSTKGIELLNEGRYEEAFKKFVILIKNFGEYNSKNKNKKNYYESHKYVDIILKDNTISDKMLKLLKKYLQEEIKKEHKRAVLILKPSDADKATCKLPDSMKRGLLKYGDEEMKVILAKVYYFKKDYKEAIWYLQDSDCHMAIYLLGNMYSSGVGTTKDNAKALELFKKSALLYNMYALYTVGNWLIEQGDKRAIQYYEKSANEGYHLAQYCIAHIYEKSSDPYEKREAQSWYEKSAKNGNKDAHHKLGTYLEENGSIVKAIRYYEETAENDIEARKKVCQLYTRHIRESNCFDKQKFREQSRRWYETSAKKNNPEAMYHLGMSYYFTETDKAVTLLMESANLGLPEAQYQLGYHHRCDNDIDKSIKYYCMAAGQGHIMSLYRLGEIYRYANEREGDYKKALFYYRKGLDRIAETGYTKCYEQDHRGQTDFKLVISKGIYDIYRKGFWDSNDIFGLLLYYSKHDLDIVVYVILTQHKSYLRIICESIYKMKRLKEADPEIMNDNFKNIKTYIEKDIKKDIKKDIENVVFRDASRMVQIHFEYIQNCANEMKSVFNNTSFYVKTLHCIIEDYVSKRWSKLPF
jgi:TPR repeat protein